MRVTEDPTGAATAPGTGYGHRVGDGPGQPRRAGGGVPVAGEPGADRVTLLAALCEWAARGVPGVCRVDYAAVEVGTVEAAVDLGLSVRWGENLLAVTEAVRRRVAERVAAEAGLRVVEIDIEVVGTPVTDGSPTGEPASEGPVAEEPAAEEPAAEEPPAPDRRG